MTYHKGDYMKLAIIGILCLLISACWEQDEVISIDKKGNIQWLVIAKPSWGLTSLSEVETKSNAYVQKMNEAGWTTTLKAIEDTKDVVVGLEGNILKVSTRTPFYNIVDRNNTKVELEFLCPYFGQEYVVRSIKFKPASASASLKNSSGERVTVATCSDSKKYSIHF